MSEDLEKEIENLKSILIEQYRENGGKKDLSKFTPAMIQNEIENQKRILALKKEIEDLKNNTSSPSTPKFTGVNAGRENAELARQVAMGIRGTMDYMEPTFDQRAVFDERFKRDNAVNKLCKPGDEESTVIIRDEEGKMA